MKFQQPREGRCVLQEGVRESHYFYPCDAANWAAVERLWDEVMFLKIDAFFLSELKKIPGFVRRPSLQRAAWQEPDRSPSFLAGTLRYKTVSIDLRQCTTCRQSQQSLWQP